ncbi:MAG: hypothetical protein A2W75_02730 [Nitrospinae bacterium RIFCSPLOWO2_12_39_15]|nr:MAG: hypothetical protein A2W75_02730 [Nitrospinae bacterium RIFCSPLOWO2_12_39_15]
MKLMWLLLISVFLSSCCSGKHGITNKHIVDETKYCESNGLDARLIHCEFCGDIVSVECLPKENHK